MTKVYKTINGHAPSIMDILLIFSKNTHNLKFFPIILKKNKEKSKIWIADNILQNTSPLGKSPRGIQTCRFFQ